MRSRSVLLGAVALLILASSLTFIVVFGAWAVLAVQARAVLGKAANRLAVNRSSAVLIAGSAVAVAAR